MTTLHEARIERAATLVDAAETARASAWDKAQSAESARLAAKDAADFARHDAWAADMALADAREAQAEANAESPP